MKSELKKYIIFLTILYAVVGATFYFFYVFLLNDFFNRKANELAFEQFKTEETLLTEFLGTIDETDLSSLPSWSSKVYTPADLTDANLLNGMVIMPFSSLFSDETNNTIMLVVESKTDDDTVFYRAFDDVLLDRGINIGSEYLLIHRTGRILYTTNTNLVVGLNFYDQYSQIYNQLNQAISSNQSQYMNLDSNGVTNVLSLGTIYEDLFLIYIVPRANFISTFDPLIWSLLTFFVLSLLTMIGFNAIVLRKNLSEEKLFTDLAKEQVDYIYLIEVGGLGQIRFANQRFYQEVMSEKKVTMLSELSDEIIDIAGMLKRQKSFNMTIPYYKERRSFRFVPVKKKRGYLLVAEDILRIGNVDTIYRNLALVNQETQVPNEFSLKEALTDIDLKDKISIAAITIHEFDQISQTLGREYSRQVVKNTIEFIKRLLPRSGATLYHSLSNHFLVIFKNAGPHQTIESVLKSILEKVKSAILLEDLPTNINLKAGLLHFQGKVLNRTIDEVYEHLMITLDRATKSTAYDLIVYDDRLAEYITKQQLMEIDLQKAIEADEFMMYLQPQYDLILDKVIGYEALLRWNNPKYIKESPAVYIRIAERSNMIIALGRLITKKVFQMVKQLEQHDIEISFNISPRQLLQPGFIHDLMALVEEYKVKPEMIGIEMTETVLVQSFELIIEKLTKLKQEGFKIHLDDFGTGYSSLSYLKNLPADVMKIDKQFVDDIETNASARTILKMMQNLGKSLKLKVIYEGVETEKQAEIIKKDGGSVIQGFLISRPVPYDDAVKLLKK